jgi:hypothetical protein
VSTIYLLKDEENRLSTGVVNSVSSLRHRAVRALRTLFASASNQRPWYTLDERLLRDIGMTLVDAETARLKARIGAAETMSPKVWIARDAK